MDVFTDAALLENQIGSAIRNLVQDALATRALIPASTPTAGSDAAAQRAQYRAWQAIRGFGQNTARKLAAFTALRSNQAEDYTLLEAAHRAKYEELATKLQAAVTWITANVPGSLSVTIAWDGETVTLNAPAASASVQQFATLVDNANIPSRLTW